MKIEPFYRHLGARIRTERERIGMSQGELGEAMGVTRASVANVEAAKQRVMAHQLPQLADALGCDVERLLMPAVFRKRRVAPARRC